MKHRFKDESGQSMVEFALVLPVLMLIIVGIIEFGFMFSSYLTVTNASREAVRFISLGGDDASAIQRVYDVSMNLDTTKINVVIDPALSARERGDSVEVTIIYSYEFITPFIEGILGNTIELEANAIMRVE